MRLTKQRKAILEALADAEIPCSAEETFSSLPADTCDLVTAYRCLEQFERTQIVGGVRENEPGMCLDTARPPPPQHENVELPDDNA